MSPPDPGAFVPGNPTVRKDEAVAALDRVMRSETFSQAKKPREFLEFVVLFAVRGNPGELKETTIGVGLYHRDPGYDPKIDSVVRTLARRVRERLDRYYLEEGADDALVIDIPKGSYTPQFRAREIPKSIAPDPGSKVAAQPQSFRRYWIAAGVLAIAVPAGIWMSQQPREKLIGREAPRVVVLPFRSSDNSPENQLYGHAMSNSIVAALTGIPGLTIVSPPTPTFPEQDSAEADATVAARLKADYLITGQIDRVGSQPIVSVKVTNTPSSEVLWSHQYSFPWDQLLRMEQLISDEVTSQLSLRLGKQFSAMVSRIPATSSQAHREFLTGLYSVGSAKKNLSLEAFGTAVFHLERALELDPDFVDAHAALAGLLAFRAIPWTPESQGFLDGAERHARQALHRAPRNSDALAALGRSAILRRDFSAAFDLTRRAVEAEPANVEALSALAEVYYAAGFYEAALQAYVQASSQAYVTLDPFAFGSIMAARLGKIEVAEKLIQEHGKADPESVVHQTVRGYLLGWKGDLAGSEKLHRRVHELVQGRDTPEDVKRSVYGFARLAHAHSLVRLGNLAAAREILNTLPPPQPRRVADEIILLASLGESAKAIAAIESSFHWRNYRFLVTEPELKPLYHLPAFRRLLDDSYRDWLAITATQADSALVRPPKLPAPEEFLQLQLSYRQ